MGLNKTKKAKMFKIKNMIPYKRYLNNTKNKKSNLKDNLFEYFKVKNYKKLETITQVDCFFNINNKTNLLKKIEVIKITSLYKTNNNNKNIFRRCRKKINQNETTICLNDKDIYKNKKMLQLPHDHTFNITRFKRLRSCSSSCYCRRCLCWT